MSEQPVVVALNGQINPKNPGGTESSVMSVAQHISERPKDISLKFISHPKFVETLRRILPGCADIIDWRFPFAGPITADVASIRLRRIRSMLGPGKGVFDSFVKWRRRQDARRTLPTAQNCDAVLLSKGVEVVHFGWPATFPTSIPFIYEPQDLQHRHYPEFFSRDVVAWRDKVYGGGCRNARFVVCGTWWTKHDIMAQFGIRSDRIAVIPRASVNARAPVSTEREAEIVAEYGLDHEFGFYPAMTFPHKNHARLIEALAYARNTLGTPIHLVCTGRKYQPVHAGVAALIEKYGLSDCVKFLGPVPDDVLTVIYRRAYLIVFPSLFEGLSQSILEGLNCGVPVVGASQSSIPETVGKAGAFFDGEDVKAMASVLASAFSNPAHVAEWAAAARKERERFAWDQATETFIAVYRAAAGRNLTPEQEQLVANATRLDP